MRFFDLHCDTLYETVTKGKSLFSNDCDVSIEKGNFLSEWGQCFAVWIPDEVRGKAALNLFNKCLEKFNEMKKCTNDQKFLPLLTVEGGAVLSGDLKCIDYLKSNGVRAVTLTWNGSCEIGDGVKTPNPKGLTSFGRDAVRRMQELGIAVDVSHASETLFWDVLEVSRGSVIATHSNAKKICSHQRNLTDAQIFSIKSTNGIIGITFCDEFLKNGAGASTSDILKHVEHFLSLGMEDNLCIGSDFDGAKMPEKVNGIESIESLCEEFLKENYSEELVDKIFFKNAHSFFEKL